MTTYSYRVAVRLKNLTGQAMDTKEILIKNLMKMTRVIPKFGACHDVFQASVFGVLKRTSIHQSSFLHVPPRNSVLLWHQSGIT